ncbi:MAG: hypothetical protein ACFFEU_03695 [Candidatus Thorarchaeota archaeon]
MASQDDSGDITESSPRKINILTIVPLLVAVLAPYSFAFYSANSHPHLVLFFPLIWVYFPSLEIETGAKILYFLTSHSMTMILMFYLFLYTLIGRLLYPYQLRRCLLGKSSLALTVLLGLVIELPIIFSLFLIAPMIPFPILTLVSILMVKYSERYVFFQRLPAKSYEMSSRFLKSSQMHNSFCNCLLELQTLE